MKLLAIPLLVFLISHSIRAAEAISILEVPAKLPQSTSLGTYSPPIRFSYSGLQNGESYELRVWLLAPGPWYCASSQWCLRTIPLDNSSGTNSEGTLIFTENMDVYSYGLFDWVIRLYNSASQQVAFTESYQWATDNRAPVLANIGDRTIGLNRSLHLRLRASDQENQTLSFQAEGLPPEASLNPTNGVLDWTPIAVGEYPVLFTVADAGDGELKDSEKVTFKVVQAPEITSQPESQTAIVGGTVSLSIGATGTGTLTYQWQLNGTNLPGATSSNLELNAVTTNSSGSYRVSVSMGNVTVFSEPAVLVVYSQWTPRRSVRASIEHLRREMDRFHTSIPVYYDIGSAGNRFHARGQLPNQFSAVAINGSWPTSPHSGATCVRCVFTRQGDNFGGYYFMNGILVDRAPLPYFGEAVVPGTSVAVSNFSGLNLSGATKLTFYARGEVGGESIEFFSGGVGRDSVSGQPVAPYPDSTPRFPGRGTRTVLSTNWQKISIDLRGLNLTNVMGGFGWVADSAQNPNGAIFYLDDIQFELSPRARRARLKQPRFLNSFVTLPTQPDITDDNLNDDFDMVLRNVAFVYDNALATLAFLADGSPDSVRRARLIGDAMLYALDHDRTYTDGRLRTAYAGGDNALPPGWAPNGKSGTAPLPGFYVEQSQAFFEVENADIDTGNNAWAMIALNALYKRTHHKPYLEASRRIGEFLVQFRQDSGSFQGFRGGIWNAESASPTLRAYASTEHNLDLFVAFNGLYRLTGDSSWKEHADHARAFVERMWNEAFGCYHAGTTGGVPDARNEIPGQLPSDTQSWTALAIPGVFDVHPSLLECPERRHYNTNDGFVGFDFNDDRDGVWFEGSGHMAVAYAVAGESTKAEDLRKMLRIAQQFPYPTGNQLGTPAASHDGISSGFSFRLYPRLHIGATAWNVFGQSQYNPYYQSKVKKVPQ